MWRHLSNAVHGWLNPHLTPVEVADECFDAGVDVVVLAGQRGRQAHRASSVRPEIRWVSWVVDADDLRGSWIVIKGRRR